MNLIDAKNYFIENRKTYCSDTTIFNYENTLRYFVEFLETKKLKSSECIEVNEISIDDLNEYVIYMRNRPKNISHPFTNTGGKLSKRSVRTYSIDLRTFFNFLYKFELTDHNIMQKFRLIKSEQRSILPITKDEMLIIDDLYNQNTFTGSRNLLMIHLMIDQGLRSGEVISIKFQDLYEEHILVNQGKGSKDRVIPWSRKCRFYYNKYKEFVDCTADDYVFKSITGEMLTRDSIKGLFSRIKQRTGINRIYPHLLRHTFATSFCLGGGNLEILRYYMGHSDINTTQKYLHIAAANQFNKEIYRLDEVFFKTYYRGNYLC